MCHQRVYYIILQNTVYLTYYARTNVSTVYDIVTMKVITDHLF
jgi:hypothetical protein